jgi:Uma2 family endonuclease
MTLVAEKKITIAEFLERDDFEEGYIYELLNGEIMRRTSPLARHQEISSELNAFMRNFIKPNKLGKIFPAPTDVYLSDDADLIVLDLNFIATKNLYKVQPSG